MNIKKNGFILMIFLVLAISAGCSDLNEKDDDDIKDVIVINYYQDTKSPVVFNHEKHHEDRNIGCNDCHHSENKGCHTCHGAEDAGNIPSGENAYHQFCLEGCHTTNNEGPTECIGCHIE